MAHCEAFRIIVEQMSGGILGHLQKESGFKSNRIHMKGKVKDWFEKSLEWIAARSVMIGGLVETIAELVEGHKWQEQD